MSKTKGLTFPAEMIPGLADGSITNVLVKIKGLLDGEGVTDKMQHRLDKGQVFRRFALKNSGLFNSGNEELIWQVFSKDCVIIPPLNTGDTLAVKETFKIELSNIDYLTRYLIFKRDGHREPFVDAKYTGHTDLRTDGELHTYDNEMLNTWRSPALFKTKLCRIFRPVVDVEAVRVQEIFEDECEDMGFVSQNEFNTVNNQFEGLHATDLLELYIRRNFPGSWDRNDWFWMLTLGEPKEANNGN